MGKKGNRSPKQDLKASEAWKNSLEWKGEQRALPIFLGGRKRRVHVELEKAKVKKGFHRGLVWGPLKGRRPENRLEVGAGWFFP